MYVYVAVIASHSPVSHSILTKTITCVGSVGWSEWAGRKWEKTEIQREYPGSNLPPKFIQIALFTQIDSYILLYTCYHPFSTADALGSRVVYLQIYYFL